MTKKVVENRICRTCGADLRPGALFCYACGKAVAPGLTVETKSREAKQSGTDVAERKNGEGFQTAAVEAAPIKKPDDNAIAEFQSKPSIDLKPAAPRRADRAAAQKPVKVVWEEPESAPNVWFLVVSVILILFAVGILWAMLALE